MRKKGKLPGECVGVGYIKDYGVDEFEMKADAFEGIETGGKKVSRFQFEKENRGVNLMMPSRSC